MIFFVDTNVFARLIMEDDKGSYRECDKFFERVKLGSFEAFTSTLVLAEVGWLLKSYYGLSRSRIIESLKGIGSLNGLKIKGESRWTNAISLYQRFNVKLTDAMIAAIPKVASREWIVVSYDEDFKKLPVKWKLPKDVI